jgi:hypothetical protein
MTMANNQQTLTTNKNLAMRKWPALAPELMERLEQLTSDYGFSLVAGDLQLIDSNWYATHAGLLRIARNNRCYGISTEVIPELSNAAAQSWLCRAVVFPSKSSFGFTGYGDAYPSNVSPAMHGAELRIAETRAVNRALRKAYGIGLCSVEELGTATVPPSNGAKRNPARLGANLDVITPIPLRDQLRQLIRQHRLDPVLTKSYALDHLGVKSLSDASREQVSELVHHLQKRLFEDCDGFIQELAKLSVPAERKEVA